VYALKNVLGVLAEAKSTMHAWHFYLRHPVLHYSGIHRVRLESTIQRVFSLYVLFAHDTIIKNTVLAE